jgi:hypothetical protein
MGTPDPMVNIAITVVRSPISEENCIGGPPMYLFSPQTRQSSSGYQVFAAYCGM